MLETKIHKTCKFIFLFSLIALTSCKTNTHDKMFKLINFQWALFEIKYIDKKEDKLIDLIKTERFSSNPVLNKLRPVKI